MEARNSHWLWPMLCAFALVGIDQVTKYLATTHFLDGAVGVLPFLTLRYFCNSGAAFSILQDYTWFLIVVGFVFVGYFSWELWRLRKVEVVPPFFVIAVTLILAGATGNLVDRVMAGCVVDFIHVHYGWFNFPIFNVADMAVCCGAASWILEAFLARRREKSALVTDSD